MLGVVWDRNESRYLLMRGFLLLPLLPPNICLSSATLCPCEVGHSNMYTMLLTQVKICHNNLSYLGMISALLDYLASASSGLPPLYLPVV